MEDMIMNGHSNKKDFFFKVKQTPSTFEMRKKITENCNFSQKV